VAVQLFGQQTRDPGGQWRQTRAEAWDEKNEIAENNKPKKSSERAII
jgi:hypothetical protein